MNHALWCCLAPLVAYALWWLVCLRRAGNAPTDGSDWRGL